MPITLVKPFIYAVADEHYYDRYAASFINSARKAGHDVEVFTDCLNAGSNRDEFRYVTWRYKLLPGLLRDHDAVLMLDVDSIIRGRIEMHPDYDLGLFVRNGDGDEHSVRTLGGIFYCTRRAMEFATALAEGMSDPKMRWGDDQAVLWRTYNAIGHRFNVTLFDRKMIDWEPGSKTRIFTAKGRIKDDNRFKTEVEAYS